MYTSFKRSKLTLLTHLSYDKDGAPYIDSALPLTDMTMPRGRLTGVFGRLSQEALKAEILWTEKVNALYGKPLSKVELYIQDAGSISFSQSIDDINESESLDICLAQTSLIDQLDKWSSDASLVKALGLGYRMFMRRISKKMCMIWPRKFPACCDDKMFFRRIMKNPEIINKLFDRQELSHIKAIIWPAWDLDIGRINMIALRNVGDVYGQRIFNFDGDISQILCRSSVRIQSL